MLNNQYDIIHVSAPLFGMNQDIAPEKLTEKHAYYVENAFNNISGRLTPRFGDILIKSLQGIGQYPYKIIEAFPFVLKSGSIQYILYIVTYEAFNTVSNFRIISENHIQLTSINASKFEVDTPLALQYKDLRGTSPITFYDIKSITDLGQNSIDIEVDESSFPENLQEFYIVGANANITYVANNSITIPVPIGFKTSLFYQELQQTKLTINASVINLTISVNGIDDTTPGSITFIFNEFDIPNFDSGIDTVLFFYKSNTPEIINISNSTGIIRIYDRDSNALLNEDNQQITSLSVGCVPQGDYIGGTRFICNGVDDVMTWDGTDLKVYIEYIKVFANTFNRIDGNNFSFKSNALFETDKYLNNTIKLNVNGNEQEFLVESISINIDVITITTDNTLPEFGGQDRIELSYAAKLPKFSFMKLANNNIYCLGEGATKLGFRDPDVAMRVYYANLFSEDVTLIRFFRETTETVPSIDISPTHGIPDNLEAITTLNGDLIFMGRHALQVWRGGIPVFVKRQPIGVIHSNLVAELGNDVLFASHNGFKSLNTINISNQVMESSTPNMDKILREYHKSIGSSNVAYRACRSFKYASGGFGGFKVGFNNIIGFGYNTLTTSWNILSGDFEKAATFLDTPQDGLYLFIEDSLYQYGDGTYGETSYGDQNGTTLISGGYSRFYDHKKKIWANSRYIVDAEYSSSFIINNDNNIYISINGISDYTFSINEKYNLPLTGDLFDTILLAAGDKPGDDPNYPDPTQLGFRLDIDSKDSIERLKFCASRFWVSLNFEVMNGPVSFREVSLLGSLGR